MTMSYTATTPSQDSLGDRMKFYESAGTVTFPPNTYVLARLDGRAFHTWTKGLDRPYDTGLSLLMIDTVSHLVRESNAITGYTQSDEITLLFHTGENPCEMFMAARKDKLVSLLTSIATCYFNKHVKDLVPSKVGVDAHFDCRVWTVPNAEEATNVFVWRELDAIRNSVNMAAQSVFSHHDLMGVGSTDKIRMLKDLKGIDYFAYPRFFQRGSYVQRHTITRPFTAEDLSLLPSKHQAHTDENLKVVRTEPSVVYMPYLLQMAPSNRIDVITKCAAPEKTNL